MALSNAERQARWREKHIRRRRAAQRVANLLVQRRVNIRDVGGLLRFLLGTQKNLDLLRRELKRTTPKEIDAHQREQADGWRDLWLRERPGRTVREYKRLTQEGLSEWRIAMGQAANAAEQADWERDHPGEEFPEHECGLSDREYTDLGRWRRQRERRHQREAR
jgi:hypothetical protein